MNAESEAETCPAWVGLEPPESVACSLIKEHSGPHRGPIPGSVQTAPGEYERVTAMVTWPLLIDGLDA